MGLLVQLYVRSSWLTTVSKVVVKNVSGNAAKLDGSSFSLGFDSSFGSSFFEAFEALGSLFSSMSLIDFVFLLMLCAVGGVFLMVQWVLAHVWALVTLGCLIGVPIIGLVDRVFRRR